MKIINLFLSFVIYAIAPLAAAEIVLVARADSPINSLSEYDIKKLYLGETRTINGVTVTILDRSRDSSLYQEFYQKILNKNAAQMRAHWARLTFTGRASPPKAVDAVESVRSLLASGTQNYVVYLDSKDLSENMTVLYTVR